jgi:hypothetical protein
MRGRRAFRGLWAAAAFAVALLGLASSSASGIRDDSAWLQAKLDAGGTLSCRGYPMVSAMRHAGSGSHATIRLSHRMVHASSRSAPEKAAFEERMEPSSPQTPSSSSTTRSYGSRCRSASRSAGCTSRFPQDKRMHGISVLGHEVTLTSLSIDFRRSPTCGSVPARKDPEE